MRFFCHVFALLVVFTLNVFAEEEDCDNPKAIDVYDYSDLPHMVTATTCGMGNDYEQTCMDYYDNGEDYIVELTVHQDVYFHVSLDPGSATYSAIGMSCQCPLRMDTATARHSAQ